MDMMNDRFDMQAAPMRIGRVQLAVRDLSRMAGFYEDLLGLTRLAQAADSVTLGAGERPLLELMGDSSLKPRDPRQAGLFHTAFLMPTRADLGAWLTHAMERRAPLQGASDHRVSEALYLADPEGNGIEVYADRAPSAWHGASGEIVMTTEPLDLPALTAAATGGWQGFAGIIGHVHLQVGDIAQAEAFYGGTLGFDVAARYPGASFFGSGGYHHQLAGNVWNSRGAGPRPEGRAGLRSVEILLRDPATLDRIAQAAAAEPQDGTLQLRDPWDTRLTLTAQGL